MTTFTVSATHPIQTQVAWRDAFLKSHAMGTAHVKTTYVSVMRTMPLLGAILASKASMALIVINVPRIIIQKKEKRCARYFATQMTPNMVVLAMAHATKRVAAIASTTRTMQEICVLDANLRRRTMFTISPEAAQKFVPAPRNAAIMDFAIRLVSVSVSLVILARIAEPSQEEVRPQQALVKVGKVHSCLSLSQYW